MDQTRRDFGFILPMLLSAAGANGQVDQMKSITKRAGSKQAMVPPSASRDELRPRAMQPALPSKSYEFTSLPVKVNEQTHGESRQVFDGVTHEAFPIDLHITMLQPGQMPHPAHHHEWEEMIFVQTGKLEINIKGDVTHVGPGSVVYVASNEEHSWKNVGDVPAQYFVLAIGRSGRAA